MRKARIVLNPSMPEAWIWLGWTQILLGIPEATITATERAQRLNPQGTMVWIYDNFAVVYWEIGRYDEALEAIVEGRRIRPDLSLELIQGYFGVSRPAVDAQRNAALRQAGLE